MLASPLSDLAAAAASHLSLLVLLVKATIILVAALGITLAMQRASAGARHLVWLVTLGMLLLMPGLTAWGPLPLRVLPAAMSRATSSARRPGALPATQATIASQRALAGSPAAGLPAGTGAPAAVVGSPLDGMSGLAIALVVWGAVLLAIAASLVWSALTVRRIVRRAHTLGGPEWLAPLWEVSDRFGLEEAPRLLCSPDAKMPFACGLLTPTIVLPAECAGWTLDRRRAVLLHELAHVRRHDLLGHTLGRLVCAVYWFHPLVWTAARQLRAESERACDDLALSCGTRATDYAEHLLDIVTAVRRDATPSVALAMARRKEFEGRMLAILDPQLRRSAPSRRQTASLIASLALIAVVVGAAAPVAREAEAAVPAQVAQRPQTQAASSPTAAAAPTPPAFERDSRVHGIEEHTFVDTRTAVSMSTAASTALTKRTNSVTSVSEATNTVVASPGGEPVGPALSSVMRSLMRKGKGDNSDDRPILLAKVLRSDTSATLRRVAAWGLSEYASAPVAADALANAVRRDASPVVREMAAWALAEGDEGSSAAMDALTSALHGDADVHVRATAAWALGNVGDHAATDALVAALGDASPDVRMRALWAIGNVGPKQAPRPVIALLSDKDARVRQLAAWALYQIEDPAAAPALDAALRAESDKSLQLDYIRALAAMGDKSVDAIRGLLESPDERIRTMAVKALAGGHAAGPWPWPWPQPRPYP